MPLLNYEVILPPKKIVDDVPSVVGGLEQSNGYSGPVLSRIGP